MLLAGSSSIASLSTRLRVSDGSGGEYDPTWGFSNTATRGYLVQDYFSLLMLGESEILPCTNEVCFGHVSRSPTRSARLSQTGLHYNHTGPVVPVDKWTHEVCIDSLDNSWSGSDSSPDLLGSVSYSMTVEPHSCQMIDLSTVEVDPGDTSDPPGIEIAMVEFGQTADSFAHYLFVENHRYTLAASRKVTSIALLLQERFTLPMARPSLRTCGASRRHVVFLGATKPLRISAVSSASAVCLNHSRTCRRTGVLF